MNKEQLCQLPLKVIVDQYAFMMGFLENNHLDKYLLVESGKWKGEKSPNLYEVLEAISEEEAEEWAIDKERILDTIYEYYSQMKQMLGIKDDTSIDSLTLVAGHDKSLVEEAFGDFTIHKSEIIAIVGPTGSGKSRLLADIEWTADRHTRTKRQIKINNEVPDKKWRFASGNKLVAQLSQNMNFVMDLTVYEFLELHASSRMINDIDSVMDKIYKEAIKLAGEPFDKDTAITSLSGGQSRALMIADTAILSQSPIVLIDEIENAGIDRKKALQLLVDEEKIVLMATHDPILALMADKRIIIKNGGIAKIIETTDQEKSMLSELEKVDNYIQGQRAALRAGEILSEKMKV